MMRTTDDENETTAYATGPLPRVETAPDPEVARIANEAVARWTVGQSGLSFVENVCLAIEAGRAPLLDRIEAMESDLEEDERRLLTLKAELADAKAEGAREAEERIQGAVVALPWVPRHEDSGSTRYYVAADDVMAAIRARGGGR